MRGNQTSYRFTYLLPTSKEYLQLPPVDSDTNTDSEEETSTDVPDDDDEEGFGDNELDDGELYKGENLCIVP